MQSTIEELLVIDTTLSHFFLDQLASLVALQRAATTRRERTARAQITFALYLDCLDIGLGPQAWAIMERGCDESASAGRRGHRPR